MQVEIAADGMAALVRERPPDLIVLDLLLPGLDGVEVCRRVRSLGGPPVIMLTARDAVEEKVAGLDAGADDYLTKPFALAELVARVRAGLRRHLKILSGTLMPWARDRLGEERIAWLRALPLV
jgi:two-component system response regulator MprA